MYILTFNCGYKYDSLERGEFCCSLKLIPVETFFHGCICDKLSQFLIKESYKLTLYLPIMTELCHLSLTANNITAKPISLYKLD